MSHGEERTLRKQLIDARANIEAQLSKMYSPATSNGGAYPPDFREQIAELEGQLREIEELLARDET